MKQRRFLSCCAAILLCANSMGLVSCSGHSSSESVPETEQTAPVMNDVQTESYTADGLCFSAKSGFYDEPFLLTVTSEKGYEIRYTLDGSTPTADSLLYTEPIRITDPSEEPNRLSTYTNVSPDTEESRAYSPDKPIDKATVIRAAAVYENGELGPIVTNTYFIGYDEKASFYSKMKIFSLVTDEENLFDEERGIFVMGKTYDDWKKSAEYDPETPDYALPANYTQKGKDWERPANLQIFENGESVVTQDVGIRIHGGASRSYAQKSLNIYARSEYGAPKLQYDLFTGAVKSESSGEAITEFDSFMLRNGGNDAQYARFRDRLNQTLVSDRHFLTQGMESCIVFINGEFWGQYDITERIDADFIKAHCGVSKKDICIIKKEQLDEGDESGYEEWLDLQSQIESADLSDDEQYNEICRRIDMQSFIDYVCAELYFDNDNWGKSNMAMWKSSAVDEGNPYADGKWRFIMYDTDFSAGIYGTVHTADESLAKLKESGCFIGNLLSAALENEQFRAEFDKMQQELADVNFAADRVNAQIDAFAAEYQEPAAATFRRFWSGQFSSDASAEKRFLDETESVRAFYAGRQPA